MESPDNNRVDIKLLEEALSKQPMFTLSLVEARALYKELEKSYINHENPIAVAVVMSLGKFIDRFGK